jgi:hypothetical protein
MSTEAEDRMLAVVASVPSTHVFIDGKPWPTNTCAGVKAAAVALGAIGERDAKEWHASGGLTGRKILSCSAGYQGDPSTLVATDRKPFNDRAGYVCSKRAPGGGAWIVVYHTAETGETAPPGLPWSVVCEGHGASSNVRSERDARVAMKDPARFCAGCRLGAPPRSASAR